MSLVRPVDLDTEIIDITEQQEKAAEVFKEHCSEMIKDTLRYDRGKSSLFHIIFL